MVGSGLKKYANQHGLRISSGVVYGIKSGFVITLSEGMGTKTLSVCYYLNNENDRGNVYMEVNDKETWKKYRIQDVTLSKKSIKIIFSDTVGTMALLADYMENKLPKLRELGAAGEDTCVHCGEIITDASSFKLVNGTVQLLHESCAQQLRNIAHVDRREADNREKHYLRGTVGALLGALIGAIPWMIVYYFGWFVGWLGFIIGIASQKGYELLGGKAGKVKFWIVLSATFLGVLIGTILGDVITLWSMISNGEIEDMLLSEIPAMMMASILYIPEYQSQLVINVGLGCVFAFLGIYGILKQIKKENDDLYITIKDLE